MRKLVALITALAFVALLATACGDSEEIASTPALTTTQTPGDTLAPSEAPTVSPSPTASVVPTPTAEGGIIRYWVPREEVADFTGRALFDVAFIPEGFIERPDILILDPPLRSLRKGKTVQRSWKWEADPSISFAIEEHPHGIGLAGENDSVVIRDDIIGELVLKGPNEGRPYPVLFLTWKDRSSYYLRAQTGAPLTQEVVLRIAASVQAQY